MAEIVVEVFEIFDITTRSMYIEHNTGIWMSDVHPTRPL